MATNINNGKIMKIISMEQNTDGWLESRKKFIGASDVPAVMGVSPWKTAYQLWENKTGKSVEDNSDKEWIFAKGHRFEDRARALFELQYGFDIPPVVIRKQDCYFYQASLDGFNAEEGRVAEIKYMGELLIDECIESGEPPEKYYPQLQWQLLGTGCEYLDFIMYREKKDSIEHIKVYPNLEYMKTMMEECTKFWGLVEGDKAPEFSPKDFKRPTDAGLKTLMDEYKLAHAESKLVEAKLKLIKSSIEELAEHPRMKWHGVTFTRYDRQGTIDYKKIFTQYEKEINIATSGFDVEGYRKKGSTSTRLTVGAKDG